MTKPACKDCFWWVKHISVDVKTYGKPVDLGSCHLRPPISGKQPWPQTLPDDFCRCFKDKEDVE